MDRDEDSDQITYLTVQVSLLKHEVRNSRIIEARLQHRRMALHAVLLAIAVFGLVCLIHQGLAEASIPTAPEFALIIVERSPLRF